MTNAGIIDYTIISTINNNNNGTDNSRTDRYGNSITESFNSRMENNDSTSINIFRYKFTKEFNYLTNYILIWKKKS